ncbi:hypothetical protein K431DRAFT_154704 [Polychaeton citri CBS 116435]|uniref:Uncharacterized protein n=1 Tax=Polychaeton citri CBS 116435 TaxID=1314669 RepID=A0A9P4QBP8_9PEZI|nr:hypothetical protein K431DRAFT_154704 [Polychaeton citri CBS 116435]
MSGLPSYEESTSGKTDSRQEKDESIVSSTPGIRFEIEASRAQHVSAVAHRLTPQIQERAKRGLSNSNFILIPAGNGQRPRGELVQSEGDHQEIIELDDPLDTTEFWKQEQALVLFAARIHSAVAGERPIVEELPLPSRPVAMTKRSWWSRRSEKAKETAINTPQQQPDPVQVKVKWDAVHFRTETPTGLMETVRADGIFVKVKIL